MKFGSNDYNMQCPVCGLSRTKKGVSHANCKKQPLKKKRMPKKFNPEGAMYFLKDRE